MNQAEVARLLDEKQAYFLPYYLDVVDQHPAGIEAAEVKRVVQERIQEQFGFDPFDDGLSSVNPSTGASAASQWANNLVSNRVLDHHVLVSRGANSVVLYPLETGNSVPSTLAASAPIGDAEEFAVAADQRPPVLASVGESPVYLRSPVLAAMVRDQAGYVCAAASSECSVFFGRDGKPYVEVHHLIPMSQQSLTTFNLDRRSNMVTVCPTCHIKMHRGNPGTAERTLRQVLAGYERIHGVDFETANAACDLDLDVASLLNYYGAGVLD